MKIRDKGKAVLWAVLVGVILIGYREYPRMECSSKGGEWLQEVNACSK